MKITKKLFKETTVRNLEVNHYYYAESEYQDLLKKDGIFKIAGCDKNSSVRVSLSEVKEINVVMDDFGSFANQATMIDGTQVWVII